MSAPIRNLSYAFPASGGFVMDKVKVDLTYCYGIKKLEHTFDFSASDNNAFAIYAPNGVMKSSLAQTFLDAAKKEKSKDKVFPAHVTVRNITDEDGDQVEGERVLVVVPYDQDLGPNEQTSVLLVNSELRKELTTLLIPTNDAKAALLAALKEQAKSKSNFEPIISSAFTSGDDIFVALGRVRDEVQKQKGHPFADVEFDTIFNDKVTTALGTKGLKDAIENYIRTYNELLDGSTFFKKGMFDYYNAGQIAESLAKNGFFEAKHTVYLKSAGKNIEINTQEELEGVIAQEKQTILKDKKLLASFEAVAKQLQRNTELRDFCGYLQNNAGLLAQMNNPNKLKEDVLKSYLKIHEPLLVDLLGKHDRAQKRAEEIAEIARSERTQWDRVISEFNDRFDVPFELETKNKIDAMLGNKVTPQLGFTYKGTGDERAKIEKPLLLDVLSNGERKALYILNVLFAVETRIKDGAETLVIVDDLADSFDYHNKYAIIEYLKDISSNGLFKLIIMTHNFDFFRTIVSRFVGYNSNLMASKNENDITLAQASGINNIFANVWKKNFFKDNRKKIASICFLRNLVENTIGAADSDFVKLTSLLHWKADTAKITVGDLDGIYNLLCRDNGASKDPKKLLFELIEEEGKNCLKADAGLGLENKVVLSIAIRLHAERFMIDKIADAAFVAAIKKDQTSKLKEEFKRKFPNESDTISILDRVVLMTPENIHLNSFMYEPLIDMSDDHLRKLYTKVLALK